MKMSLVLCLAICLLLVAVADGTSSFQDARGGYMFLINTDKGLLLAVKDNNCYFVPLSDLRLSSYSAASFSAAEDHVIEMLTGATPAQVTLTSEVEMMNKYDDLLDDVMCRGKMYFEYRVPGSGSAVIPSGSAHRPVTAATCRQHVGYWLVAGKYCVRFYADPKDYDEANRICSANSAHLFDIKTVEDMHILDSVAKVPGYLQYVGATDKHHTRSFTWSDGTPLPGNSNLWRSSTAEPNNAGGHEACVEFDSYEMGINDLDCMLNKPFTCQIS